MKKVPERGESGIIYFFQMIKSYQNYFANLAKMLILSLSTVDFDNQNKSLGWVVGNAFQDTVNCFSQKGFWVLKVGAWGDFISSLFKVFLVCVSI